jgi:hypothetical protein
MLRTLIERKSLKIEGREFEVQFFEVRTLRGQRRYSAEILLAPGDQIILDGDSASDLEAQAARLVPATLHSRTLPRTPAASQSRAPAEEG